MTYQKFNTIVHQPNMNSWQLSKKYLQKVANLVPLPNISVLVTLPTRYWLIMTDKSKRNKQNKNNRQKKQAKRVNRTEKDQQAPMKSSGVGS